MAKMCCNIYSRVIIGIAFTLVFLIPCILFNVGVGREWNKKAIMTKCLIVDYIIIESKCGYDCNCETVCEIIDDEGEKITHCYNQCEVCWKICYNGYVDVIVNTLQTEVFALTDDTINLVESRLNNTYPINTTVTCYRKDDDVKFSKDENMVYFGFYIFFTIVACIIASITLIVELYLYFKS